RQGPARSDGRGDPSGQHLPLFRRRMPEAKRRTAALGPVRGSGRDHPRTAGRGDADYAVEFPDGDPGLENRPRARLWQLRGVQTRRTGARLRMGTGRHYPPCGRSGGGIQSCAGQGRAIERRADGAGRSGGQLYRLGGHSRIDGR
ncbi:hypothetical protein KXW36_000997, partial [Aspergillus fumigatus]